MFSNESVIGGGEVDKVRGAIISGVTIDMMNFYRVTTSSGVWCAVEGNELVCADEYLRACGSPIPVAISMK